MNKRNANLACSKLTHGGTCKGLLQIAAADRAIIEAKGNPITSDINTRARTSTKRKKGGGSGGAGSVRGSHVSLYPDK